MHEPNEPGGVGVLAQARRMAQERGLALEFSSDKLELYVWADRPVSEEDDEHIFFQGDGQTFIQISKRTGTLVDQPTAQQNAKFLIVWKGGLIEPTV